ncbi:YdcF family protein [Microbacterium sp. KUDC0406]|uniref:YdcF family protein n=1 Tax=Microbacterium sp. KUDC0406 TaxID=2909588 RepID=UPI001F27479D|nr:YdcF family protein [Microbacterium sp. KUDC0406]UJP11352.1 YdcF family protein [Microbacterium sp. KUDC0406]
MTSSQVGRTLRCTGVAVVTALIAVLAWSEVVHERSSRRRMGADDGHPPRREAVVVLGFRNRGTRANAVNRYRVRAGLRSLSPDAGESVLVLCGGAVGGPVPEAELLAAYARRRGYAGPLLLDTLSRSTRQNIENAIPLVEASDQIRIVSNSPHAELGRAYLWELRPDLGARLRRAREHRFGEVLYMKPYSAVRGLGALARLDPGIHDSEGA